MIVSCMQVISITLAITIYVIMLLAKDWESLVYHNIHGGMDKCVCANFLCKIVVITQWEISSKTGGMTHDL